MITHVRNVFILIIIIFISFDKIHSKEPIHVSRWDNCSLLNFDQKEGYYYYYDEGKVGYKEICDPNNLKFSNDDSIGSSGDDEGVHKFGTSSGNDDFSNQVEVAKYQKSKAAEEKFDMEKNTFLIDVENNIKSVLESNISDLGRLLEGNQILLLNNQKVNNNITYSDLILGLQDKVVNYSLGLSVGAHSLHVAHETARHDWMRQTQWREFSIEAKRLVYRQAEKAFKDISSRLTVTIEENTKNLEYVVEEIPNIELFELKEEDEYEVSKNSSLQIFEKLDILIGQSLTESEKRMLLNKRFAKENTVNLDYNFSDTDSAFTIQNIKTYKKLLNVYPMHIQGQRSKKIGLRALKLADKENAKGNSEEAKLAYSIGKEMLDIALGLLPGVSLGKDAYELVSGKNLITGEMLGTTARSFALLGIVTLGTSNYLKSSFKIAINVLRKLVPATGFGMVSRLTGDILDSARKLGIKTKEGINKLAGIKKSKNASKGLSGAVKHDLYKKQLRSSMPKPKVQDKNLFEIIDDNYRPNAKVGSGSTADALRHEKLTGNPVGGKRHAIKAREQVRRIQRWLDKNPHTSGADRSTAEQVMLDLMDALGDI